MGGTHVCDPSVVVLGGSLVAGDSAERGETKKKALLHTYCTLPPSSRLHLDHLIAWHTTVLGVM